MIDLLFNYLSFYDLAYIVIGCGVFAIITADALYDGVEIKFLQVLGVSLIWPLTITVMLFLFSYTVGRSVVGMAIESYRNRKKQNHV